MLRPLQLGDDAPWKRRYRAAAIVNAQLARGNPARGLVTSTQSGQYQLYAWDVRTGFLRQLTHKAEGVPAGTISHDGKYVYFLQDQSGNEMGHLVRMGWEGGEPQDLTPDLPPYSAFGMSMDRGGTMLGTVMSDESGFHLVTLPLNGSSAAFWWSAGCG